MTDHTEQTQSSSVFEDVRSALHFTYGDDAKLGPALRAAFMAGFATSGEGWNGEYPFNFDPEQIDNALDEKFHLWLRSET